MAICWVCGEKFSVRKAKAMFEEMYTGEFDYDDCFPDHDTCGECALIGMEQRNCGYDLEDYD